MFNRALRLTKILKQIDGSLYAKRVGEMLQIWRKSHGVDVTHGKTSDSFILALTDNWTITGKAVDWGIEPLLKRLREMDAWTRANFYDDFTKERDKKLEDKERTRRNDRHALALDMYKDRRHIFNN